MDFNQNNQNQQVNTMYNSAPNPTPNQLQNNQVSTNEENSEFQNRNSNLCQGCSKCCEYISMEIDTPKTEEDFQNIRWYLLHKNIRVFVTDKDDEEYEDDDEEDDDEEDDDEEYEEEEFEQYGQINTNVNPQMQPQQPFQQQSQTESSQTNSLNPVHSLPQEEVKDEENYEDEDEYDEDDEQWFIQFYTPCKALTPDGWCGIYDKRPSICKEHSSDNCEKNGEVEEEKLSWTDPDEFWRWVEDTYDFKNEDE